MTWLKEIGAPDIVCLQEIKCVDEAFPRREIEALGYNVVTHGQKTFNGVALLSKLPFDETKSGLAGDDEDAHARFLEGVVTLKRGVLRVACLYLPNGNPVGTEKYPYKLKWMSRLLEYSKERLKTEEPLVLAGDFNVIPARPRRPQSRRLDRGRPVPPGHPRKLPVPARPRPDRRPARGHRRARASTRSGITRPAPGRRTRACASTICCCRRRPATGSIDVGIDSYVRAWEKPSDHVPVWADLRSGGRLLSNAQSARTLRFRVDASIAPE